MLTAFRALRYRNVTTEDLSFGRVNLLIGANNSGKSHLIEAVEFLAPLLLDEPRPSASGASAFLSAVQQRGGSELLDRGAPLPGEVELRWTLEQGALDPLQYDLAFRVGRPDEFPDGFHITRERLGTARPKPGLEEPFWFIDCHTRRLGRGLFSTRRQQSSKGKSRLTTREFAVRTDESVFRQLTTLLDNDAFRSDVYPLFSKPAEVVRAYARGIGTYSSTRLDLDVVAAGARVDLAARRIGRDGADLVNVVRRLDQERDPDLQHFAARLRELLPDLQRVKVVDVSESHRQLELHMGGRRFKLREMSDGTIKAVVLALLLCAPVEPLSLVAIDEPELNLHPAWLRVIAGWMLAPEAAQQLFVSTHAPDLLDGFTDAFRSGDVAVFVCELGGRGVRRLDPQALESSFEAGWELGDLYRVGEPRLGGWPW